MNKIAFVMGLFAAAEGLGQTAATKDPDTLQALLAEVHQLRLGIEAMTVASQRVQIALYGLQMQDVAVARATQRLDEARNRCRGSVGRKGQLSTEMQALENKIATGTAAPVEVKALQSEVARLKSALEAQTAEAQACEATEAEASNLLRNEQGKMAELQDRIERLDKALEKLGGVGR